jgi:hypothetical protein
MVLGYNEIGGANMENFFDTTMNPSESPGETVSETVSNNFNTNNINNKYRELKKAFDDSVKAYNENQTTNNLNKLKGDATAIINHVNFVKDTTTDKMFSTQNVFGDISGIITDGTTNDINNEILNKKTTFNKKYNNIKEQNDRNKKIIKILLSVNIVILAILLFGSYLVASDKRNPFGKSRVSNNKNNYNNLSSL